MHALPMDTFNELAHKLKVLDAINGQVLSSP